MKHHSEKNLSKRTAKLEKELAAKKHELEVEAALEKVRVVAMKMKRPADLLDICKTLYKGLLSLGFTEIRNAMINIHNDADKSFINYDYSDELGESTNHLTFDIHPLIEKQIKKTRSTHDAFSETYFTGKDLTEWKKFRKRIGEKDDPRLKNSKGLYYYLYSIGTGSIGISTFGAISKKKRDLLKRFRNVFQLSYQRYSDIALAETQAREAEIELALERVRAKTMAMQKSDELQETTLVLFQQFKSLKVTTSQFSICVFDEDTKMGEMFVTLNGKKIDRSFPMELDKEVFVMKKAKKAFLDGQKRFLFAVKGKELQNYNHWRNTLIGKKGWDESNAVRKQAWYVNGVFFSRGLMGVSSDAPATAEALKLLDRFASVFDLTFTRFLDLQKAEAQAREAQIEAALERVRSRSMAMHRSDEVHDVADVLFQQMRKFGGNIMNAGVTLCKQDADEDEYWLSSDDGPRPVISIPHTEDPIQKKMYEDWENKSEFFSASMSGRELKAHYEYMSSVPSLKPFFQEGPGWSFPTWQKWHAAYFNHGYLFMITLEPYEEEKILVRFAKVFEQAYTRFLDLQKVEAQAREARIEAALEKVRSRSLAMHTSEELQTVINEIFIRLRELNVQADSANIMIFSDHTKDVECWTASPASGYIRTIFPYADFDFMNDLVDNNRAGVEIFSRNYTKEQKNAVFTYFFETTELRFIPAERKKFILNGEVHNVCVTNCKRIAINVNRYTDLPFSEGDKNILVRFTKVFYQCYTRFLDLQKAEAQAREAQIEAALERVRSRTMAMHQTSELQEVIHTVHKELLNLNLSIDGGSFVVINGDVGPELRCWGSGGTANTSAEVQVPHFDMPFCTNLIKGIKRRPGFFTEEFSQKEKEAYFTKLFQHKPWSDLRSTEKNETLLSPGGYTRSVAVSKHTSVFIINHCGRKFTEDENDILKRFANVFEQTYTRFLDLQKAEAQAREAQIELGLERVRARAMAMQNSNELSGLVAILFDELVKLDLVLARCIIWIFDSETLSAKIWMANSEDKRTADSYYIKRLDHPYYKAIVKAWKEKTPKWVYDLKGANKRSIDETLLNETELSKLPEAVKAGIRSSKHTIISASFNNFGFIEASGPVAHTEEQLDILSRFGKVFDLSYTRFSDLKQAEAQARESQIQLALERVRARTMAMQRSDELSGAASLLFQQVQSLGAPSWTAGYCIWDEDKKAITLWMSSPGGDIQPPFRAPLDENPTFIRYLEAGNKGLELYIEEESGKVTEENYQYLLTLPVVSEILNAIMKEGYPLPTYQVDHCAYFTKGFLLFITYQQVPELHDIFKRFAAVFDQTYTRFLDLQKAESQARESQIQLALERVRARTMAMQKSSELAEASQLLYEEFRTLDISTFLCGYCFMNEEEDKQTVWVTLPDGTIIPDFIDFPLMGDPVLDKRYEDWKQKKPLHILELQGEANKEHHRFLMSKVPDKSANEVFAQIPDRIIFYCANFSSGYLFIIATEFFTPGEEQVIMRFAKVFELTYTRFSDLKQAEGQARESQIQLALERVRARTMAMHRSEELSETAQVLFQQLLELGGIPDRISIGILDEPAGVVNFWSTDQSGSHLDKSYRARLNERLVIAKTYQAWKDHKKSLVIDLHGDDVREWVQFAREEMGVFVKDEFIKDRRVHNLAFFSHGWILVTTHELQAPETVQILERFASVFSLTYRRFLDLEKAESQAREAQIEAALERVRSRSMAMHQSSDLHEVIKVITEQLFGLGLKFNAANFAKILSEGGWDLWISTPQQLYPSLIHVPYIDHRIFNKLNEVISEKAGFFADVYGKEEKDIFIRHFFENTVARNTPEERKQYVLSTPGLARSLFLTKNIWFSVLNYDGVPFGDEENAIFKRFANAFEQTYTRFLDLQKAEANAREAQIEASLERVRSKTMAMHNSNDVGETVATMFAEFVHLGIHTNRCGILIFNDKLTAEVWTARSTPEGNAKLIIGKLDLDAHKLLRSVYNAWKAKGTFYQYDLLDEDLKNYYTAINNSRFYPTQFDLNALPSKEFHSDFFFADGAVFSFTGEPVIEDHSKIMKRFAGVFGQTYRRYLDLQKAEAQAREAQIEAALERVRARTMAMHKSSEVTSIAVSLNEELLKLGFQTDPLGGSSIMIVDKETGDAELWAGFSEDKTLKSCYIPYFQHPYSDALFNAWKKGEKFLAYTLTGDEKKSIDDHYFTTGLKDFPESDKSWMRQMETVTFSLAFMKYGAIHWGPHSLTEEQLRILERFSKVFEQSYTRFLDLQKAEAQAKEAQIEAGLERVRARTMAMHTSDDVSAATATMFTELEKLGIENFRGGITNMLPNRTQHVWSVTNIEEGKVVRAVGAFNMDDHPFWQSMYNEWQKKNDFIHYFLADQEKDDYVKILNSTQGYLARAIENFPDVHFQVYFFNEGGVWTNSLHAHTDEEQQIMKRFTSVFSLTFRRYQDLKKAEAQAREATIEAALEKVRGKAMAMHNSNDLSVTASMVFTELRKLGISPIRCGVGLLNKDSRKAQLYSATSSPDGDSLSLVGWVILSEHPVLEKIYDTWLDNEEYYPELHGEQMRLYYEQLLKGLPVTAPDIETDKKQYGHFFPFSVGCLYAWSDTSYSEADLKILKRFATIIDLTFRRYIELQQSEANAREAVKQAALDRIRADIASMRKVEDLDRITPLIWSELTILGLPFIRCGIFLMDDSQRLIHTFLSTPDGKAIGAFHLPYHTPSFDEVVNNWRHNKIYFNHWTEPDYVIMADTLVKQGAIKDREQYVGTLPVGGFYLHFIPFLQGMLYVGNRDKLGEEEIDLLESVADAFSTAYARYEDFNKLEAAKQQVEKTLTDLKQAQTQLVQSEKMASLGELTAGIAHEIQNPLNFVNNFSDVSNELLDEMKEELAKGNIDDAIAIASDVKQNLEKINHHGKRADGIVKGMLQHSRISTGQKELTDINALADEYLRLAYHGLRAKDKSFNAKFETSFNENVGKTNIIPQDIGRVILNLINNAFYAVSEKKKQAIEGYEPSVTINTGRDNGRIEVKVKDNGNGIPRGIVDKIFQPFFTTKPTGQGTGLGLSLAYDIIKAHGGEIKVETKEGEGSEFVIQLPAASNIT